MGAPRAGRRNKHAGACGIRCLPAVPPMDRRPLPGVARHANKDKPVCLVPANVGAFALGIGRGARSVYDCLRAVSCGPGRHAGRFRYFRLRSGRAPCGYSGPVPCGYPGFGIVWPLGPSAVRHATSGGIWFTGGHRVNLVCTTARRRHFPCMRSARALDITGKASVLVAKRSESHPGCAEETWLRRGHPVGKHGAARTGQAGNAFPRTVSAPHGARTWLPSFIRYRRFGNEMLQVQPRRPHQR